MDKMSVFEKSYERLFVMSTAAAILAVNICRGACVICQK
jgi:hypothetical protein